MYYLVFDFFEAFMKQFCGNAADPLRASKIYVRIKRAAKVVKSRLTDLKKETVLTGLLRKVDLKSGKDAKYVSHTVQGILPCLP
jgi:hypothetical protein